MNRHQRRAAEKQGTPGPEKPKGDEAARYAGDKVVIGMRRLHFVGGATHDVPLQACATMDIARDLSQERGRDAVMMFKTAAVLLPGGARKSLADVLVQYFGIVGFDDLMTQFDVKQSTLATPSAEASRIILAKQ